MSKKSLTKREIQSLEYPKNLAKVVLEKEMEVYPIDFEEGVEKALSLIYERDRSIIERIFRDNHDMNDIANDIGVSYIYVSNMRNRGIRRLRNPEVSRFIKFGVEKINNDNESLSDIDKVLNMSISELGLPTKAYNCLRRSTKRFLFECNEITDWESYNPVITVCDAISMLNDKDHVRAIINCGVTNGNRILTKLNELGVGDMLNDTAMHKLSIYKE